MGAQHQYSARSTADTRTGNPRTEEGKKKDPGWKHYPKKRHRPDGKAAGNRPKETGTSAPDGDELPDWLYE